MLQKLRDKYRQYGALYLPVVLFKGVLGKLSIWSERYYVYEKRLTGVKALNSPTGYLVREIGLPDLLAAKDFGLEEKTLGVFRRRLAAEGYRVYGAFHEQRLVAYGWLSLYTIELPDYIRNHGLVPGEDEAYLLDAFCQPGHRGHGLQKSLLAARMNRALEEGMGKVITIVRQENLSSRAAVLKMGFTAAKLLSFTRVGEVQRVRLLPIE